MAIPQFDDYLSTLCLVSRPPPDESRDQRGHRFRALAGDSARLLAAAAGAVQGADRGALCNRLERDWEALGHSGAAVETAGEAAAFLLSTYGADYGEDYERLTRLWSGLVACAGLAYALGVDNHAVERWLQRAIGCWNPGTEVPPARVQGYWTQPDGLSDELISQGLHVEAADLTAYLRAKEKPALATAAAVVEMRVLLVDDRDKGFVGALRLERLRTGSEFVRSPGAVLMPCDSAFLQALRIAGTYRRQNLPELQGAIRWDLACGDFIERSATRPAMAAGGSLGGALGVGLRLLANANPESDLTVAITAELRDERGRLGPIGAAFPKLEAAAAHKAWPIRCVLYATGQQDVPGTGSRPPRYVSTVAEAEQEFLADIRPRQVIRELVAAKYEELILPGGARAKMDELYRDVPLLQEVDPSSLPERDGPGGRGSGDGDDRAAREVDRWNEGWTRMRTGPQRLTLQQALARPEPVVVLGPPGSGKTTMLQYLAWQSARPDRSVPDHSVPVYIRLRSWETWGSDHGAAPELPGYLAQEWTGRDSPGAGRWKEWLEAGSVLLLLDGLDEVANVEFLANTVREALARYKKCPRVLSCREVSRDRLRSVGIDGRGPRFTRPRRFRWPIARRT